MKMEKCDGKDLRNRIGECFIEDNFMLPSS